MAAASLEKSALLGGFLNIGVAFFFRIFTFCMNALILRQVSGEVLGIINVRLLLLVDTILFISREAFRKACLKRPAKDQDWRGTINLIWLSVPLGALTSIILGSIWMYLLEQPKDEYYPQGVILIIISTMIELIVEPFFILGQIFMWVKFRSGVDILVLFTRGFLLTLLVVIDPSKAVLFFGLAHLASNLLQLTIYLMAVKKALKNEELKPLKCINDVFPCGTQLDKDRWTVAQSFLRQGWFKLTQRFN